MMVSNQSSITTGAFAQYEIKLNKFKVVAGARFDHYEIKDLTFDGETKPAIA